MPGDARRQKLVYRESTRRTVCPVIERGYALAGAREAECFLAESRIILRRDKRTRDWTVARRLAIRSPIAISRWSLLLDRRASCDSAHVLRVPTFRPSQQ